MENHGNDVLEIILRECAAVTPEPWYPADYVRQTGVARDRLDSSLDDLRLGGLVRLTEWVKGKGQGYALTPAGTQVLDNPRYLQRLRRDGVAPEPVAPPLQRVESRTTTWDRGEAIRRSLLEPRPPIVTFLLIAVNVLVYFAGSSAGQQQGLDLVRLAELTRAEVVLRGEWYRLLSYSFVHGGIMHIGMNMLALWMLGRSAEPMFGPVRYLVLYLVAGLGGGCAVALQGGPIPTVGASGSICGLFAAMGAWVFVNRPYLPPAGVARWFRGFTTNLFLLVMISIPGIIPGVMVSWAGHLGGAIAGAVVALPLVSNRFGLGLQRWLGLAGVLAVPAACLGLVFASLTNQERDRQQADLTLRIVVGVEKACNATRKDHVRPFLEDQHLFDKAERRREAAEATTATERTLRSAADRLSRISFTNPKLQDALQLARKYVSAWSNFFEVVKKVLDQPGLLAKEKPDLKRLFDETQTLTQRLNRSALIHEDDE